MRSASIVTLLTLSAGCSEILADFTFSDDAGADGGSDAGFDASDGHTVDAGPPLPDAPILLWPPNGYASGSAQTEALDLPLNALRPRLRWLPVEGADTYDVALSSQCDAATRQTCSFAGASPDTVTSTEWTPATALAVSTTTPLGRRYFWRVRACNEVGCSAWSEVRFVDVGRLANDANGDGYSDLIIGNAMATVGGVSNAGRASLLLGPALDLATLDLTEQPPTADAQFGERAVMVADLNGDGFADYAVGAPRATVGGRIEAGRVSVFLGGAFGALGPATVLESSTPAADARFAHTMAGGGDSNADGYADLAVGAPVPDGGSAGAVYVFHGAASGIQPPPMPLTSPAASTSDGFGSALAWGDLDADGFGDLIVGAPGEAGGATSGAGRVYVYWGARGGLDASPSSIEPDEARASAGFGFNVASGEDVDVDGWTDLIVAEGNPNLGPCGSTSIGAPSFHVVFGGSRAEVGVRRATLTCADWANNNGSGWVALARDATGDGSADALLLSYDFGLPAARAFAGASPWTFDSPNSVPTPFRFFTGNTGFGDFAGDGIDDVWITATNGIYLVDARPPGSVLLSRALP
ncbi:MAG: FG-GAP repeat protein [Sandaracinaceae bacterium]|nr:FG-GAP repeat protein [Sandaracinaceae bacterium]